MELRNRLRESTSRFALIALLIGAAALALAACDSGTSTTDTPTPGTSTGSTGQNDLTPTAGTSSGEAKALEVNLKEWVVDLGSNTELTAGNYNFNVINDGQFGHDLVIQDSAGTEVGRIPVFKNADGSKPLQAELKPGTYKFFCDVPGHADRGMKTQVTVK